MRVYRFDTEADLARYRGDMRRALSAVDINRPFVAPLRHIPELDDWFSKERTRYGVSEETPTADPAEGERDG